MAHRPTFLSLAACSHTPQHAGQHALGGGAPIVRNDVALGASWVPPPMRASPGPMGNPAPLGLVQRLRDMAVALSKPKNDGAALSGQLQEVADAVERLRRDLDESEATRRAVEGQSASVSEQRQLEVQALQERVGRRDADIKTLHAKLKEARNQAAVLHAQCEEKDHALQGAGTALHQAEVAAVLRQQEVENLREQLQSASVTFRKQLEQHMEGVSRRLPVQALPPVASPASWDGLLAGRRSLGPVL